MSLTGSSRGTTRADIIKQAKDAATSYYGETCIDVTLSNEETVSVTDMRMDGWMGSAVTGYTADWTAEVKHRMEQPAYGFAKCVHCRKEARKL